LWTGATEGTELWLQILSEIHNRGVKDILIACGVGLEGACDAFQAVFPRTETQVCIAHFMRNSLAYAYHKEQQQVAMDLRSIYLAVTAQRANQRLTELEGRWSTQHPGICRMWRSRWNGIGRLFKYPEEIRRSICTTNVLESLHKTLRTAVNTRTFFPSEESTLKFLHLALRDVPERWRRAPSWRMSLIRFEMRWGERIEAAKCPPIQRCS
jgi:transposase-like protein